ncbi:M24 family metallopeptidase [Candidatus Woesearchaeota archaeon]|nr:M24 family metallopeptidase [Candidatus Woesearchaeota archaeon]
MKAKFVDISKKILELRRIKSPEEIKIIKKSCKLADSVMRYAISKASSKLTEIQLRELIDNKIKEFGVEPSFPAIVASNNDNPHYRPENKKLNGFVVIDLGVRYKNYCSDITRTIYVGKPTKNELYFYDKVLKLQESLCKSNETGCKKLDMKARLVLGEYFTHSLGHGIGVEVHELPNLGPRSKDKLKNGMVYTIEPGYYNKFGIRIEDDVLFFDKPVVLTNTVKKLIIKN